MNVLVISDVHANWTALQAVLRQAASRYDQVVCCGDLVGYNSFPGEVVDWTMANCSAVIRGNHDKAVANGEGLEWFNDVAKRAAVWTRSGLSKKQMEYLRDLKQGPIALEYFHMWHGSPRNEDEYITSSREASECFSYFDLPLAFFGHTHVQGGFFRTHGKVGSIPAPRRKEEERVLELEPDVLYLVNPGSVGQPRDGDSRAAYVIFNSEQRIVTFHRVNYSIDQTARGIHEAGLPDVLALRLFQGF